MRISWRRRYQTSRKVRCNVTSQPTRERNGSQRRGASDDAHTGWLLSTWCRSRHQVGTKSRTPSLVRTWYDFVSSLSQVGIKLDQVRDQVVGLRRDQVRTKSQFSYESSRHCPWSRPRKLRALRFRLREEADEQVTSSRLAPRVVVSFSNRWIESRSGGRWSLLARRASATIDQPSIEKLARILLRRYGVVFKRLLEREGFQLAWRELLKVYHRLKQRGEIRGGRFISKLSGEQFATADAVGMLRPMRRAPSENSMVSVSAADPLNLIGIITPGDRVSAFAANRVLYRDGVPIAKL